MMNRAEAQINDALALSEAARLDYEGRHEEARQIRREIRERQERDRALRGED